MRTAGELKSLKYPFPFLSAITRKRNLSAQSRDAEKELVYVRLGRDCFHLSSSESAAGALHFMLP